MNTLRSRSSTIPALVVKLKKLLTFPLLTFSTLVPRADLKEFSLGCFPTKKLLMWTSAAEPRLDSNLWR